MRKTVDRRVKRGGPKAAALPSSKPARKKAADAPGDPADRPARKRRIRNPGQTRARLLQATVELLAQKGPDALSLKEAALVANVSRGVAYQHFRDRDHLLSEAKAWLAERLSEFPRDTRPATMEQQVHDVARLVLENREASSLFLADALAGRVLDDRHPLILMLGKAFGEFTRSGDARADLDVEVLGSIMLGAIASMIMLGNRQAGVDVEELARRFTREFSMLLRRGIFAAGSPYRGG